MNAPGIVKEVLQDIRNGKLPTNIANATKRINCDIEPFQKIYWYYDEDLQYCEEEKTNPKQYDFYSGIVVPMPNITISDFDVFKHGIVIVTDYNVTKDETVLDWVSFKRLADDETLIEIYKK